MSTHLGQGSFMLGIKSALQFIRNTIAGMEERELACRKETHRLFTFPISHLKKTALCMLPKPNYHQDVVNKYSLHLESVLYCTVQNVL